MIRRLFLTLAMVILLTGSSAGSALQIIQPNGGVPMQLGSQFIITWTSSGITSPLRLVLRQNGMRIGNIADNLPANATSYAWTVGNYISGTVGPGTGYAIRIRTVDNTVSDDSDGPFAITDGPFALTAPNGGESWPLNSTRQITWTMGNMTGNVRLDLYRGGTAIANKVGVITTNTPASTGKYSWEVGKCINVPAAPQGDGYLIVITSYTPEMKDSSNAPFTIAKPQMPKPSLTPLHSLSLTNPRRGDRWSKGTGYTIKWTSAGLAGVKLKLDLMKPDGTTLVQPIAENIANSGQHFWLVPMSLPDAETLYRMRIRTMDNAYSDTPAAFYIAKAKPPAGPPAIKVTDPGGPAQIDNTVQITVRWTSTCGTSVNGPTDDAFDIDLMNAAGTEKIKQLWSGVAQYDGGNPDGSHSWHWKAPANLAVPGTYRIRVTNWSGRCVGLGEPFTLVYPQEINEYTIRPVVHNCFYLIMAMFAGGDEDLPSHAADLAYWGMAGGDPALARVGFRHFINNTLKSHLGPAEYYDLRHQIILRSYLEVNPYWSAGKGQTVIEARIVITRKWAMPPHPSVPEGPTHPCLGGVFLLEETPSCQTAPDTYFLKLPPQLVGQYKPVSTAQGDTWEVDVTQFYQMRFHEGKPDLGWVLLPKHASDPGPGYGCHCQYTYQNVERYDVYLKIRLAKEVN